MWERLVRAKPNYIPKQMPETIALSSHLFRRYLDGKALREPQADGESEGSNAQALPPHRRLG
ncbi:MAG: hypothetical protein ACRD3W_14135 [Terriglobales bacterium]